MGVLQNFQKFRVRVWKCYRTDISSGYCATCVYNSQKFRAGTKHPLPVPRVLWDGSYRIHMNSGYGYESLTELPEVPGTGMKVLQNFQKFRVLWHYGTGIRNLKKFRAGMAMLYSYPGYLWHWRTELPEVPGTGKYSVSGEEFDLKWRIPIGGFHRACMACSDWANVPEAIRRNFESYRQPPLRR